MDEQEIEQRQAELDRREAALRNDRLCFELRGALAAARCRPDGIDDALAILASEAKPQFDTNGRITKVVVGGEEHPTAAKAVEAFLSTRAHWLAPTEKPRLVKPTHEAGDSGSPPVYSAMDLVSKGWLKPPA